MPDKAVRLHAVGDVSLGDHPLCVGFGTHSRCRLQVPGFAFEQSAEVLRDADIVFGNLECTISESGLRPGKLHSVQMRGHPAYVDGLSDAGFSVLNLANNHSMQHGEPAFQESVRLLSINGIAACGLRDGTGGHAAHVDVTKGGLRTTFLGYSLRPRQYFPQAPLYAEGRTEALLDDVRSARDRSDCVVVSLHWGTEFIGRPAPDEVDLAHQIVRAGAQLVIGHHPHVLRGIERFQGAYIIYSLGNFVCDMIWDEPLRQTAIARCMLTKHGIESLELVPARINDDYQPVIVTGTNRRDILDRIGDMSRELESSSEIPPSPDAQSRYDMDADLAQRLMRKKAHRYFLRQAYRSAPGITVQQLSTYVRNRLSEKGWIRMSHDSPGC
jgi:gamma-polyglutamate biosynthesis protein CapA